MQKVSRKAILFLIISLLSGLWFSLSLGILENPTIQVVAGLRLPRAILAMAVGIGLSLAGIILQAVFSNPLAEPYTLGISSGAAVGAVIASSVGLSLKLGNSVFAIMGALLFGLVLIFSDRRQRFQDSTSGVTRLLLTGMMLTFIGSSWIALIMAISDSEGIQSALFWLLGDLSRAELRTSLVAWVSIVSFGFLTFRKADVLDLFLLGSETAKTIGLDVEKQRRSLLILASVLVAASVASAGMVGFVGLMIPHFARRLTGAIHRRLIPVAALMGAAVVVWADLGSRTLFQPIEIPVGVITALMGAPLFVFLIQGKRGQNL